MKPPLLQLALLLLLSCSRKEATNDKEVTNDKIAVPPVRHPIGYVSNPNPADTMCRKEIARAKRDIENGKLKVIQPMGFMFGLIRYEYELKKLCKENELEFDVQLLDCVQFEGQTQGCYGAYMDKIIALKYGIDFKEKLHQQADRLFLTNVLKQNQAVEYWDCDEWPRLPGETKRTSDELGNVTVKGIDIIKAPGMYGGWPLMDVGFIVEKDSTINGFYSRNFASQLKHNDKYEPALFKLAVKYVKKHYPKWVPGTIKGNPVRTDANVRIYFVKEG